MTVAIYDKPWSKSALKGLLDGCGHRFWLEKIVGLPSPTSPQAVLGVAYHAVVEAHERARLAAIYSDGAEGSLDGMTLELALRRGFDELEVGLEELDAGALELHDLTANDLHEMMGAALTNWYQAPIRDGQPGEGGSLRDRVMGWRPVAAEPYFSVPHPSTVRGTHGFIDAVYFDHGVGEWVVVDAKSTKDFRRWPLDGSGHEDEAAMYVVSAETARSLPVDAPVRMEWHVVRTRTSTDPRFEPVRVVSMGISQGHRRFLHERLALADERVDGGVFEPNPSWNLCSAKWCQFFDKDRADAGGLPCNPTPGEAISTATDGGQT